MTTARLLALEVKSISEGQWLALRTWLRSKTILLSCHQLRARAARRAAEASGGPTSVGVVTGGWCDLDQTVLLANGVQGRVFFTHPALRITYD